MSGRHPDGCSAPRSASWRKWVALSILAYACCALPARAHAQIADPCPSSMTGLAGKTPDDLSIVQADIDRYTLCAKRAELLKKLNELAVENDLALKNSAGLKNPGMVLGATVDAPPAGPDAPLIPASTGEDSESASEAVDDGRWKIVEIFGAAGKLQAKLSKADGAVARVKAGSVLPGGGKVVAITPVRVTLQEAGGESELAWRE